MKVTEVLVLLFSLCIISAGWTVIYYKQYSADLNSLKFTKGSYKTLTRNYASTKISRHKFTVSTFISTVLMSVTALYVVLNK